MRGTNRPDIICAGGGNDRIVALNGKDRIRAGGGNDRIRAGAGKDKLAGGAGDDVLAGEANDDQLDGGAGADDLDGGAGQDHCDDADADDILDTNCVSAFSVRRFGLAPAVVDATLGAAQIQVTAELEKTQEWFPTLHRIYLNEEEQLGVPDFGNLARPQNLGYLSLSEGTPDDGVWTGTITVPEGTATGPHALSLLLVEGFGSPAGGMVDAYEVLSGYDLMRADLPFGFLAQ